MSFDKEGMVKAFIEADCKKFSGLLQIYVRMIEANIPFAKTSERAQGMADAVKILQDGVDKAEKVAKKVLTGEYEELQKKMGEEKLRKHDRSKN